MLVEIGNRIINTDHIVGAEPGPARGASEAWRLTLSTGEAITLDDPHPSLAALCGMIVPAPAGFRAVEAFLPGADEPDRRIHYRTSAVLAFRVVPGPYAPAPITAEGELIPNEDVRIAVVDPTGHCVEASAPFEALDEFKLHCESVVAHRQGRVIAEAGGDAHRPEPETAQDRAKETENYPTAELRARILAEPIRPMTGKALWSDEQGFAETVEAVRRAHPALHTHGIGHDPKARAEMTDPGCIEEFERALRFLSHAGHRFRRPPAPNRKRSSYSWKHAAERVMGDYVSNGMLIAAAYALGFIVTTEKGSLNAWINLSEEAISLDPGKGAA